MIDTIFFDNWNTLVQAPYLMRRGASIAIFNATLKKEKVKIKFNDFKDMYLNITKTEFEEADANNYREINYENLLRKVFNNLDFSEVEGKRLSRSLWHSYLAEWPKQTEFFPDTLDTLYSLMDRYKLGVITNYMDGPTCRVIFENLGYENIFDSLIISAEIGYRKPSPIIFHEALKEIKSKPENSLMVGDSIDADILGAIKVGIKNVLIDHGYTPNEKMSHPDAIIKNIGEMKKIIKQF